MQMQTSTRFFFGFQIFKYSVFGINVLFYCCSSNQKSAHNTTLMLGWCFHTMSVVGKFLYIAYTPMYCGFKTVASE
jgi:hypothetical protein